MADAPGRWRRLIEPGLSRRALAAAGARKAELRHAVRVSAAVGAAFALTTLLRLPQGYWAVFTAVIVVQTSIGGTIAASTDRLIGTIVGAFVGAGAAYLKATSPLDEGLLLCGVVALLSFAAAIRPSLRVAPVTAVIVLIAGPRDIGPLHAALYRVIEIVIGGVAGVAATLLIFPARAHETVVKRLSRIMIDLAALLGLLERRLGGEDIAAEADRLFRSLRTVLAATETSLAEAARENASRLSGRSVTGALPRTLGRIRNDAVMISRALGEPLPATVGSELASAATALLRAAREHLAACRAALSERAAIDAAPLDQALAAFEGAVTAMRDARLTSSLTLDAASRVFGLVFALESLAGNLGDLAARISETGDAEAGA